MKIILAALVIIGSAYAHPTTVRLATKPPAPQCDETLWKHVYAGTFGTAKNRLQVIDPCKTVTGTIVFAGGEPDADFHIRLKLDSGQASLLNAKNKAPLPGGQGGFLVVEPICQKDPKQDDVVREGVCDGFRQNLAAMTTIKANVKKKVGTHVEVTGAFIKDAQHGWNEIHPVTSIVIK